MFEILDSLTNVKTGEYILWGIALIGLIFKILSNAFVKSLMKSSENMATTKKKCLRTMKQKYENRRSLGLGEQSKDFVEKHVRNIKFLGRPIVMMGRRLNLGILTTIMVTAGAFLFYDNKWNVDSKMFSLLMTSVIVCAFLEALENIFLTRNKLEIMKANIRDYLDNMSEHRMTVSSEVPEKLVAATDMSLGSSEKKVMAPAKKADAYDKETVSQDENLDSFLKEFFS